MKREARIVFIARSQNTTGSVHDFKFANGRKQQRRSMISGLFLARARRQQVGSNSGQAEPLAGDREKLFQNLAVLTPKSLLGVVNKITREFGTRRS